MKLYIARHGDATNCAVDSERTLSEEGRVDVQTQADFIAKRHVQVSRIFHSGKVRAQETAEILAAAIGQSKVVVSRNGLDPSDVVMPMAQEIIGWEDDVMLVGHLPFVSRLTSLLLANNEDLELVCFRTSTIVCLKKLETGVWIIDWVRTAPPTD